MTPTHEMTRESVYPSQGPESHPYAKVIADSISGAGHRLTTFEVRFHRFVLAEFNTHRVFSRNSASSRARPAGKNLDDVWENLAVPVRWGSEKRGMQAGQEIDPESREEAEFVWRRAAHHASVAAEDLIDLGVHKSIVNRLLEPFMMHTVIVTATAWENFFEQRCSPLAQPEIQMAAEMMRQEYEASTPHKFEQGEWHLPYITPEDTDPIIEWSGAKSLPPRTFREIAKKVSVARCARVSYLTHDGKRDIREDLDLYRRLTSATPMHASPLEHVATPDAWNVEVHEFPSRGERGPHVVTVPKVGNFLGWRQHRLDVEVERGLNTYG